MAPLSAISLFSGVGMLDEGLRAGLDYLGIAHRTVCHVEREAYAAAVLVARMEEGSLDAAPVWSCVTSFDARQWRGKVDCVVAGFPCQDLSVAGRRAGLDGSRSGLFFEVVRIAADCGAWLLFLENVAGIASATATVVDEAEGELEERAAARVLGELADLGWDAEWIVVSAADVGASHQRERWFCLAWKLADAARHGQHDSGRTDGSRRRVCQAGDELGDASRDGRREGRVELQGRPGRSDSGGAGMPMADSECAERRSDAGPGIRCQQGGDTGRQATGRVGNGDEVLADAGQPRLERREQPGTFIADGRTDGRTDGRIHHIDQLPNFVMYHFSRRDQTMTDGQTSLQHTQSSRRHLNPIFAAWLMGWPSTWVIAEPHASSASATASWRQALRSHLSSLLDGQDFSREAA